MMAGATEEDDLPLSPNTAKSRRPVSVPPSLLSVWAVPLLCSCHHFVGTHVAVLGQVLCAQCFFMGKLGIVGGVGKSIFRVLQSPELF